MTTEARLLCECDVKADTMPHTKHDTECPFRVAMERILKDGYPA